jgi:SAM-dependent methyltransferase
VPNCLLRGTLPAMTFDVAAESYDQFMGRYSRPLAPLLADFAGIEAGQRVLDVGCGTGSLTSELVRRVGSQSVAAIDPSESFVEAMRARFPGVEVQRASAERLPFPGERFDAALAQLVVHFMADPVAGIAEMGRVTGAGGVVAACVWDHAGGKGPLAAFWDAARQLQPGVHDESDLPGVREGHLAELFEAAGLTGIESTALSVTVEHPSFDEWWQPFTNRVGPAGAFVASLEPAAEARLRGLCLDRLGEGPLTITALFWAARGRV